MTLDLSADHYSEPICPLDVHALALWVEDAASNGDWIVQSDKLRKPQRLLTNHPIVLKAVLHVLKFMHPTYIAQEIVLSRMMPRQQHGYHQDQQGERWLTRVHVPITTNGNAWHEFEGAGIRFHMLPGWAYTFNATRRHGFGNDGTTPRVHLVFDVLRT